MTLFKRWRLRREIDKEQGRVDKMRRLTPHADVFEITRSQARIRRLVEELAEFKSNRKKGS